MPDRETTMLQDVITPKIENTETEPTARQLNPWTRDWGGQLTLIFGAFVVVHILYVFYHWGGDEYASIINNLVTIFVYLGPCVIAWRTSRQATLPARTRHAWRLIALADLAFLLASVLWLYFENYLGEQPFPSWADAGYLIYYPLMMWGLLALVEKLQSAEQRLSFFLDSCIVLIGGGMVLWHFLLGPIAAAGEGWDLKTILSLAYPVGDLVLLIGIASLLMRSSSPGSRAPVNLVLVGMIFNFAADFIFGYQSLQGTYQSGDPGDALFTLACYPVMLAAHYQYILANRTAGPVLKKTKKIRYTLLAPYLAVVSTYAVLIQIALQSPDGIPEGAILVTAALTGIVLLRQYMYVRESVRANAESGRAAEELRNTNEQLEQMLAHNSAIVYHHKIENNEIVPFQVSPSFTDLFGYTTQECLSYEWWFSSLHPDDREAAVASIPEMLDCGSSRTEYRVRHKDGSYLWIEDIRRIRLDEQGQPAEFFGVWLDISERRRTEEIVRETQANYKDLFENSTDLIQAISPDGRIDYVNNAWKETLGYSDDEISDISMFDIIAEEDRPHCMEEMQKAMSGEQLRNVQTVFIAKGGRRIAVEGNIGCKFADGKPVHTRGIFRDVTEWKRVEAEREVISEIIQGITSTSNLKELFQLINRSIGRILYAENCFVALHDQTTGMLHYEYWVDKFDPMPDRRPIGPGFGSYVLRTEKPLLLNDEQKDRMYASGSVERSGTKAGSWLGVPLQTPSRTIGILVVQHYENDNAYSQRDLEFLNSVGAKIAITIERKRFEEALRISEEQHRLLFERNPQPAYVYDIETLAFLAVNNAAIEHYGYSREEFLSTISLRDIQPSEDIHQSETSGAMVFPEEYTIAAHSRHRKKDGTIIDVEITSHVLVFNERSAEIVLIRDVTERNRTEKRLLEAEERWKLALRVNHDGIWDWDFRSRRYFYSPRWREMFGYDEIEEIDTAPSAIQEFFHPDDRYLAEKLREGVVSGREPYFDIEFRHVCKDGSHKWTRCRAEAILNPDTGKLERLIGLNTDIEARKRSEMERDAIGRILRGVSETSNLDDLLNMIHQELSKVVYAENCYVALYDKNTELLTLPFFVDTRDAKPPSSKLGSGLTAYVFKNEKPFRVTASGIYKLMEAGDVERVGTIPAVWMGVPLRTPDGIIGVLVVQNYDDPRTYDQQHLRLLSDIGDPIARAIERKTAEDALRASEERMRLQTAALESAANGVVITDGLGTIEWVNPAFTRLTGYNADEAIGQNPRILNSGKNPASLYENLWQTILKGEVWKGEIVNKRKNGQLYDEEMTITPVWNGDSIGHYVAIKQDISERKQAEQKLNLFNDKLQQSNRELQDFAYVASHDLQEPLRKVQAFSDRLKTKFGDKLEGDGLDYLERMRSAASRMQLLIQDLLSFSRVSTKAQPFIPVDLNAITQEVLSDLEVKIEETGAVIESNDLPTIDADPLQMRQLIQNLVGNALKFRIDGVTPVICIRATPTASIGRDSAGMIEISVKDNGIGFDEKYADKIFAVFQRLHGRAEYEGSGVGLAICRKIAERHNGTIVAHSHPGEGAEFVITLPAKQTSKEEKS